MKKGYFHYDISILKQKPENNLIYRLEMKLLLNEGIALKIFDKAISKATKKFQINNIDIPNSWEIQPDYYFKFENRFAKNWKSQIEKDMKKQFPKFKIISHNIDKIIYTKKENKYEIKIKSNGEFLS